MQTRNFVDADDVRGNKVNPVNSMSFIYLE
jgi:hypothetical protein